MTYNYIFQIYIVALIYLRSMLKIEKKINFSVLFKTIKNYDTGNEIAKVSCSG